MLWNDASFRRDRITRKFRGTHTLGEDGYAESGPGFDDVCEQVRQLCGGFDRPEFVAYAAADCWTAVSLSRLYYRYDGRFDVLDLLRPGMKDEVVCGDGQTKRTYDRIRIWWPDGPDAIVWTPLGKGWCALASVLLLFKNV